MHGGGIILCHQEIEGHSKFNTSDFFGAAPPFKFFSFSLIPKKFSYIKCRNFLIAPII